MTWKLWLDDQLDDPATPARHTPEGFVGAKSSEEALTLIHERGLPSFMDLDHDLGGDDTVMRFLHQLTGLHPEGPIPEYRMHTENVVGAKSIEAFLRSWKKSLSLPTLSGYVRPEDILSFVYGGSVAAVFTFDSDAATKIRAFKEEHNKLHKGRDGAIGGRFTFSFTPTTLFTRVDSTCACGAEIDVTDYGSV